MRYFVFFVGIGDFSVWGGISVLVHNFTAGVSSVSEHLDYDGTSHLWYLISAVASCCQVTCSWWFSGVLILVVVWLLDFSVIICARDLFCVLLSCVGNQKKKNSDKKYNNNKQQ